MAQLGKFERTILDNQGNPLSGITVAIYNQGATLSAAGSNPYTVYDPGALTTAYTVQANTNSAITKAVTVVAATSITTQGIGLGSLVATDRLVGISPVPTLYSDATGTTSTGSNTLTTDANGYCTCWIVGGAYDLIISGTGYSTRLITDFIVAAEARSSNAFDSAANPAWKFGTTRTVASSPLQEWHNPYGTRKCYITPAGGFNGSTGTFSGAVAVTGSMSVTGGFTGSISFAGAVTMNSTLAVTGATSVGALTGTSTGTFASTLTASSGFTMTAGTFSVPANTISKTYIGDGTADQTFNANPYATANYVDVTNATVTFTPASSTSEIVVMAAVPYESAGNPSQFYAALRDSSNNILYETTQYWVPGAANLPSELFLLYRVSGLTGSQTFKMSCQSVTSNGLVKNSTNAATKRICRVVAIEHKF